MSEVTRPMPLIVANWKMNLTPSESAEFAARFVPKMARYGEAIYGSECCRLDPGTNGVFTRKGDAVYLLVLHRRDAFAWECPLGRSSGGTLARRWSAS